MCQTKNKYIIPSTTSINEVIIADGFVKNYNAIPVLTVLLSDFERPQEFAKWLKLLLKADKQLQKKRRKKAYNCQEDKYQNRLYFIKELIKGIKAGIPMKQDGTK